jgi:GT2 family glycosyltransferase
MEIPEISYIIVTYGRKDDLLECVKSINDNAISKDFEIIVVDNKNEIEVKKTVSSFENVRYFALDRNLGVAGGRNFGISVAKGHYFFFIDDDAIFKTYGFDKKVLDRFKGHKEIGAVAFKILNFRTLSPNIGELPFPRRYVNDLQDLETSVSYFVGTGHAIRRDVLDRIGLYPEDFLYGGEELYLSYKIIRSGYSILYLPEVVVLHKKSSVRLRRSVELEYEFRNKIVINRKFLPNPYLFVNNFFLFGKFFYLSLKNRALSSFLKGALEGFRYELEPDKIGKKEIDYLKKYYGRLWY